MIRVGLHMHSNFSPDSHTRLEELVAHARANGLDRLALTDHNTAEGSFELMRRWPELAITGEEVRATEGEVIGLFISETIEPELKPEEVMDRIHAMGGLTYIPHPFDPRRAHFSAARMRELAARIDIIETYNQWCRAEDNAAAAAIAKELQKPVACGSDAHAAAQLGHCWMEMEPFANACEFLDALRRARMVINAERRAEPA